MPGLDKFPKPVQKSVADRVKSYPTVWRAGVCAFGLIDRETGKEGYEHNEWTGSVCHAAIRKANERHIVVNGHKKDWQAKNPDYLRWVFCEAPFSHGLLNTDEKEFFDRASVFDVKEIGPGGTLWMCKALRHFTENTYKLETWTKLREQGLDGLQALIGANILSAAGEPQRSHTHEGLFCYTSPKKLRQAYDEIRNSKKIGGTDVNRGSDFPGSAYSSSSYRGDWGALKSRTELKPDGWGGFIEVRLPSCAKNYAETLKEILTGDPSNVK
jgi:hypothetical protein